MRREATLCCVCIDVQLTVTRIFFEAPPQDSWSCAVHELLGPRGLGGLGRVRLLVQYKQDFYRHVYERVVGTGWSGPGWGVRD